MTNIQKTIEALKEAERLLDNHVSDPKYYNDYFCNTLEIISWDINKKISELQELYT